VSDKARYFTTPERTQRLDIILHLIENIEIIPLVRGPEGIGKSTLALRVRQSAAESWSVCLLEADASLSPERLLANIYRCFGWVDQQADALEALVDCFETMRDEGQVPVLLIDDAHLLPASALIILLRLFERQRGGEPLVSIVLFADEQIDLLLATPQLRIMTPQAIQIIDLPPLNRDDATRFMRFLLQQEGVPVEIGVDETRLTKLYRTTRGIPGPLGQRILESLSETESSPMEKVSLKPKGVLLGGLGLALLGAIVIFQDRINQLFIAPPADGAQAGSPITMDPAPEVPAPVTAPSRALTPDLPVSVMTDVVYPPQQQTDAPEFARLQQTAEAVSNETPLEPSIHEAMSKAGQETEETHSAVSEIVPDEVETSLPAEDAETLAQSTAPVSPAQPDDTTPQEQSETEDPRPAVEEVVKPVATATAERDAPITTRSHDLLEKADWIRQRPSGRYTLQLLGVERLQSLKDFVARYDLQDQAFYYVTRRKGKPWHPLLWGDFPDKNSAIKGSELLPPEVRRKGYWVRRFGDLQAQLDR